jgi:phosphatidylglycerophosphatase A
MTHDDPSITPATAHTTAAPAVPLRPRRASARFMVAHPARWIALGFGSGLSPIAPGTVGTLWAWAAFLVLQRWLDDRAWALLLGASALVGWWACTRTARDLNIADPSPVVWDEVLAFWLILWVVWPASWTTQLAAFVLFRLFDAVKRGPVGWADRRFKLKPGHEIGWMQGFGILFDDLVAALCTLLVMALWCRVLT